MRATNLLLFLVCWAQAFNQTNVADDSIRIHTLLQKGAEIYTQNLSSARQSTTQALAIAQKTANNELLALCYKALAFYERKQQNENLLRYDSLFLLHAQRTANVPLALNAYDLYAKDLLNQNRLQKAAALLERGTQLAGQHGDKDGLARLIVSQGFYHQQQNNLRAAASHFEKSLVLFTELKNDLMIADSKYRLAYVNIYDGAFNNRMLDYATDAIYIYRQKNKPSFEGDCYDLLGYAYQSLGNKTKALPYYWQARELFSSAGYTIKVVNEDVTLAQLYLDKNNTDSSGYYLAEGETLATQTGYDKGLAMVQAIKTKWLAAKNKLGEAEQAVAKAQKLNNKIGRGEIDLMINQYLAEVKAGENKSDSSALYLQNNIAVLKKLYPPSVLAPMIANDLKRSGITDEKAIGAVKKLFGISDSAYAEPKQVLTNAEYTVLLKAINNPSPTSDSSLQAINQKQLVEMEEKYGRRLLLDSTALQQQRLQLAGNEIRQKNLWLAMAILLLLIFLLAGFYLYKSRRQAVRLHNIEEAARKAEEKARHEIAELKQEADHRVGNTLQLIQALIGETKATATDRESFQLLEGRVEPLVILYNMLRNTQAKEVWLQDYFEKICTYLQQSYAGPKHIEVKVEAAENIEGTKASTLGLIVNELVTNAFKYAFAERNNGLITLTLKSNNGNYILHVADNGVGITKRSKTGTGLGIIEDLTRQIKGEVKQFNNTGANFEIIFQ